MQNLGDKLKKLRQASGLSQKEVAMLVSRSGNQTISKWENDIYEPGITQFLELCHLYGVVDPYATFVDETDALNTEGWLKVREYAEMLRQIRRYTRQPIQIASGRKLPVYELPASAGTGQFLDSDQYEMIDVEDDVPPQANFGVRVAGDSMEPRYKDGDVVWVQQQPTIKEGEVGIFLLNGEAYIKVFSRENRVPILVSINENYMPIIVPEMSELKVFGKVVV